MQGALDINMKRILIASGKGFETINAQKSRVLQCLYMSRVLLSLPIEWGLQCQ